MAGGEHLEMVIAADEVEKHPRAERFANPVMLHQGHTLGPAVKLPQGFQQIVGVFGDAQEPLGQLAFFDGRPGTPAVAVNDLFIG